MKYLKISSTILIIPAIWGCSFLKERPAARSEDASFVKEVRKISNSLPTEVELVDEQLAGRAIETVPESSVMDAVQTVMTDGPEKPTVMTGGRGTARRKTFGAGRRGVAADGSYMVQKAGPGRGQYRVGSGDTLMKIAFEKYGDITKWREIYELNKGAIAQFNTIYPGMVLTLGKEEFIVVERNGKPYLIRRNDTLISISNILYGNISDWKLLYENNRQLIKNPDKIYAGFKLYYLPK